MGWLRYTIARFLEAVSGIAVARKYHNPVSALLQSHSRIHHQALRATYPQVRVQKDDSFWPGRSPLFLFVIAAGHRYG